MCVMTSSNSQLRASYAGDALASGLRPYRNQASKRERRSKER